MNDIPRILFRGRMQLPDRRCGTTVDVTHTDQKGVERRFEVTFGFDADFNVREIFIWPNKAGADIDAMMTDAGIGISHALQRGASITELAAAFGQLRPEGAPDGEYPPASPLGTILRAGIVVERMEKKEQGQSWAG